MEISCPNCGARYQVPEAALGANGRDVTCSACGHVWRAFAPQAAPQPAAAPQQPAPMAPPPQQPEPEPEAEAGRADRGRQMAEIRQMLDEVQTAERRRAPEEAPHAARRWSDSVAPIRPPQQDRRDAVGGDDDEADAFLRERLGGGQAPRGREQGGRDGDESRRRMMTRHERRQRKREEVEKRGSGSGYTAFTFVVLVSGLLIGLYALGPSIAENSPETAPAIQNYMAAVDQVRVVLVDQYERVAAAIAEQMQGES